MVKRRETLFGAALLLLLLTPSLWAQSSHPAARFAEIAVYPTISASAIVVSPQEADLSAQIVARVESMEAQVGSEVEAGDVLVTLECDDYRLAVDMASAQLAAAQAARTLAETRHQRSVRLLERNLASQDTADTTSANRAAARAELDRAQAALDIARLDMSRCQVRAPFDGTVSARHVSTGQLASAGTVLVRLVNHTDLEVSAQVSERDLSTFNTETDFTFYSLTAYPVTLARRVRALDPRTRTQEIRLEFSAEQPLPGSAGKVTWASSIPHLSKKHLVTRDGVTGFFTAEEGRARFVPLGNFFAERDHPVELAPETLVITGQLQSLNDGDAITFSLDEDTDSPAGE